MSGIFVSYRRSDSAGYVGRICDSLTEHFGPTPIFRDIDSIAPGLDFPEQIGKALGSCEVMLAVVGAGWLTAATKDGRPRLQDPKDYVRQEIKEALDRKIRVIPVLVGGATMPSVEDLPPELGAFAQRNALELSDSRWKHDVGQLLSTLETTPGLHATGPAKAEHRRALSVLIACGVAALVLLSAYYVWMVSRRPAGSDPSKHAAATSPVSPFEIESGEGGNATLLLRLLDVYGRSLPGNVNIDLIAMNGAKRDDSRKPITRSRLRADAEFRVTKLAESSPSRLLQVSPDFHYPVGVFVKLHPGQMTALDLTLPIVAENVRRVSFPKYTDLTIFVQRLLEASRQVQGHEKQSGQRLYDSLDTVQRAMLLNVVVKLEPTRWRVLFHEFAAIERNRVFLYCRADSSNVVAKEGLLRADASLQFSAPKFAPRFGFQSHYRTGDAYAPMRLTFYSDGDRGLAELSFDEGGALGHVFQGIRGYTAVDDSHPYTIHEILKFHQKIDPLYRLEP